MVNGGRLEFQTTDDDTSDGDSAFTFLAEVGGDFVYEGVFDNPVFGASALGTFSQYGLIISMTGAPGASTGGGRRLRQARRRQPRQRLRDLWQGLGRRRDQGGLPPPGSRRPSSPRSGLTLEGDADAATLTGRYELLDGAGQVIGSGTVGSVTAAPGSALQQALSGASGAADPAFGVTSTDVGGGGAFTVSVESLRLAEREGGDTGGRAPAGAAPRPSRPVPWTPSRRRTTSTPGPATARGTVGAAKLEIMTGVSNVEASNYGANSFKVTNVGDKKISAIFIDATEALYPDSVFDPDGKGRRRGLQAVGGRQRGRHRRLRLGLGLLPARCRSAAQRHRHRHRVERRASRGAMVKFSATSSGGFEKGEVVGFSGDMDPNSIAGLLKGGPAGVDTGAVSGWDVGGISGHELIGSSFTVLFDDGTTATGELASDRSASGSHALATQAGGAQAPGLTVGGVAAGGTGTYGVTAPSVIVTGDPGDTVRITLTKGLDPGHQRHGRHRRPRGGPAGALRLPGVEQLRQPERGRDDRRRRHVRRHGPVRLRRRPGQQQPRLRGGPTRRPWASWPRS